MPATAEQPGPAKSAKDVFLAATNLPADQRKVWLKDECRGDADLLRRVEVLLAAHDAPGSLVDRLLPAAGYEETRAHSSSSAVDAGSVIAGRYKLLQQIGEGGMGAVWMADQTEPVKRRVAVKLIRVERGQSKTILSRFEAERQAIALMDHPNIAKLLDAGTTDEGSPYFVMELVKGVPLTEFCDAHRLSVPQRLHLFMQVCSAVQHAHQKGIIHRDLKPGNILVEDHDGKPVPKVIDFGLAKATTGLQLTDRTLFTAFGSVMGTPLYMAPEQANFNAIDVDTRADVYALGVLLYELLTGTTPITHEEIKQAQLDELLRLVREREPPTPSSRLSTTESKPNVAANRHTEPATLGSFVKGELDWIVMKALAKERDRRYETATGFAKDVERFLNHEPVAAGPPTPGYRMRKFVQRHRGTVAAGTLVLTSLLIGVAGATTGLLEARRQAGIARNEADAKEEARADEAAQRALAEANARKADTAKKDAQAKEAEANAVVKFFQQQVFAAARPKGRGRGQGKAVSLRDAIVASLPALDKAFADQPLVEARLRHTLGITFLQLGEARMAETQFARARALRSKHVGPDHPETLQSMTRLALSYEALGRDADALKLHEETLATQKRVLPANHPDILSSVNNLALSYSARGRHAEALKLHEETLATRKRLLPADHPDVLSSMNNLANGYFALGRHADALALREETLAARKRVLPANHRDIVTSMYNLAASYSAVGRHAEALKFYEEVLAARKRVLPADHPDVLLSTHSLASTYASLGRDSEALKLREETVAAQKRVLPADHPDTLASMNNLANSYFALGRLAEALKLREETLAARKRVLPVDHPDTLRSMHNLANSYDALNRHADALALREEMLAARRRALPADHPDILLSMWVVALSLVKLDRGAEAVPLIDACVAQGSRRVGVNPRMIPAVAKLRLRHFQKTNDVAGCRTTSAMWEELDRRDVASLYSAARYRAVTASLQAKAGRSDAPRLAKEDADKAMAWLRKAVAAGYTNAAHIRKDADLDFLRDRDDFKKLLADLEAKSPPKKDPAAAAVKK
jgi:eukaryotic-like serine/threonine-protein kinase